MDPRDKAELAMSAALRNYRLKTSAGNLRILRGSSIGTAKSRWTAATTAPSSISIAT